MTQRGDYCLRIAYDHNDRAETIDMRNRKNGIEKKEEREGESNSDSRKLGQVSPTTALNSRGNLNRDPYC